MKSQLVCICIFALACAGTLSAQTLKTVNVSAQGTLKNLISIEETKTVSTLTVTGTIDALDIAFLRDKMKVLSILDLSHSSINSYAGNDGTNTGIFTVYPANEMPEYAFYNPIYHSFKASLTSISLPTTTISIGTQAFYYCWNLAGTFNIPASVTSITDYAFYGCSSISAFAVPNSNPRYSTNTGVLFNKSQDTLLLFPALKGGMYTVPSTVKHIGASSFENCYDVTSIALPSTITSIGSYAFSYCSGITGNLSLPTSLTKLGDGAFYGCWNLTGTVSIPASLTKLGNYCFLESKNILSYNVHADNPSYSSNNDVLYSKHSDTLFICPPAKTGSFTIPASVKLIGSHAFYNCSKLTGAIVIPATVDYIGYYSFYGCSLISDFQVDDQNLYFSAENNVLLSKNKDRLIACPISKSGWYQMPSSVKEIDPCAFAFCGSLTGDMNIPASVKLIGNYAFYYCNQLTGYNVENGNSIYSSASDVLFNKNKDTLFACPFTKVGKYEIPTSVNYVGVSAFDGCINLTDITIPNSVLKIGNYAFEYCTGITKLHLNSNTDSIGSAAFYNCTGLQSIEIENTTPPIVDYYTFDQVNKTSCKLTVPTGFASAYQQANYWEEFSQIGEQTFFNDLKENALNRLHYYKEGNSIVVEGLKLGDTYWLYSIQGTLICSAKCEEQKCVLNSIQKGIYIFKTGNKAVKILN